jgi:hypothetical protein
MSRYSSIYDDLSTDAEIDERIEVERFRREETRRYVLLCERMAREEVNHVAAASWALRRAVEVLTPTYRQLHSMRTLKDSARRHIARARALRTLIGPPCPSALEPF